MTATFAPRRLVLPRRPAKPSKVERVVAALLYDVATALSGGFWLMLLVPYVHQVLGTPDGHPGYWPACVVLALAKGVARSFAPYKSERES
jgi:hypothetical protein